MASPLQRLVSLRLLEEAGVSLLSTTVQAILPWSPQEGSCPPLWARVCVSDAFPGANPSPELPVPWTPAKMCSLCMTGRHGWASEGPHQRCRHPLLPCAAQADLVLDENYGGKSHDGGAPRSRRDNPQDTLSCGSVRHAATSCHSFVGCYVHWELYSDREMVQGNILKPEASWAFWVNVCLWLRS